MSEQNFEYWVLDTDYGPIFKWDNNKNWEANDPQVALDYYRNKLQVLVYDSKTDEPIVAVRYNDQMEVVEVQVFNQTCRLLNKYESSPWQEERDRKI